MVAAEERKTASRKAAVQEKFRSPKGKENKDKIPSEHKDDVE